MVERELGRRSVLSALAAGAVLPALGACSGGGKHKRDAHVGDGVGVVENGGGGMDVLMIIRHAEKPTGSGAPYGLSVEMVYR